MTKFIKDEFRNLDREIIIMPVIAKDKIMGNKNNQIIM